MPVSISLGIVSTVSQDALHEESLFFSHSLTRIVTISPTRSITCTFVHFVIKTIFLDVLQIVYHHLGTEPFSDGKLFEHPSNLPHKARKSLLTSCVRWRAAWKFPLPKPLSNEDCNLTSEKHQLLFVFFAHNFLFFNGSTLIISPLRTWAFFRRKTDLMPIRWIEKDEQQVAFNWQ